MEAVEIAALETAIEDGQDFADIMGALPDSALVLLDDAVRARLETLQAIHSRWPAEPLEQPINGYKALRRMLTMSMRERTRERERAIRPGNYEGTAP